MSTADPTLLSEVSDRLAIADVLARYARGIDRCDLETLQAVWWPGATADYGNGPTDAVAWSSAAVEGLAKMLRTQHFIGNLIIELKGDIADVETYCRAYHEVQGTQGVVEMEVAGRYLDRLERRGAAWRIAERRYVMDWNRNGPATSEWHSGIYAGLKRRGHRKPNDPLYTRT